MEQKLVLELQYRSIMITFACIEFRNATGTDIYVTSVPVLNRFLHVQIWPAEAPTSISRRLDAAGVHS